MISRELISLDIETTGLDTDCCEIIEVAAVRFNGNQVTETFQSLIRPSTGIPLKIQQLTGITNDMVAKAPGTSEVIGQLKSFIGDRSVVGHNIGYDLRFLSKQDPYYNRCTYYDTLPLARIVWPQASGYRLESLAGNLKIAVAGESHRALHDALAAKEIFCAGLERLIGLGPELLLKFLEIAESQDSWPLYTLMAGLAVESANSLKKASLSPIFFKNGPSVQEGEGLFAEKDEKDSGDCRSKVQLKNENQLLALLENGGPLKDEMPDYKYRPQQVEMFRTILDCLKNKFYAVIEAGTGTGKSLAYLLPVIYWSNKTENKIVIATNTINLQEQLWNKDIPSLERILGCSLNAALVKGRSNYLCLRKWERRIQEKGWKDAQEINFYLKLLVWLNETEHGDKSELTLAIDEKDMWQEVACDTETCIGTGCGWFNKLCFVMRAKRKAEKANLLIVNHSLVFADMKTENKVLPDYSYIILDEAHHLEDSATEHFGSQVTGSGLERLLRSFNKDVKEGRPGLFLRLRFFLTEILAGEDSMMKKATDIIDRIIMNKREMEQAKDDLSAQVKNFINFYGIEADLAGQPARSVRIRQKHLCEEHWQVVKIAGENLWVRMERIAADLEKLMALFLSEESIEQYNEGLALLKEIQFINSTIYATVEDLKFILANADENYVYWFETTGYRKEDISLKAAPIEINRLLWDKFFSEKKSAILTSATLSVDGKFDHYISKIGLDLAPESVVKQVDISSPFEYEEQALLCVVNDLPNPTEIDDIAYAEAIVPVIADIVRVMKGRTLCLFTSHRLLKESYDRLLTNLKDDGIHLLGHNIDGGRKALVEEFKKGGQKVLLGATSFWEGVDLAGELLSCVVIVKIPFAPPTAPTMEARIEQLQKEKRDGFYNYSVPQAVIRLKQGFGRLIRKEQDSGVVVILDKRIVEKRYGRKFLRSLPLKRHFKGDTSIVIQKIRDWLERERQAAPPFKFINSGAEVEDFINSRKLKTL